MDEVFDLSKPDDVLADQLLALPADTNFGQHALARALLYGKGGKEFPLRWRAICSLAEMRATSTEMKTAMRLQMLNAQRRLPGADMNEVFKAFEALWKDILDEGSLSPLQMYNAATAFYNGGIVLRLLRRYLEAAYAQMQSSGLYFTAGRNDEAKVGLFVAAVEFASHALVDGSRDEIAASLNHLLLMRQHVKATCVEYPAFMADHAATHIAWAHLMAGMDYSGQGHDLLDIMQVASESWCQVFNVAVNARTNLAACLVVADAALEDINLADAPNPALTIMVLKALALRKLGRESEAYEQTLVVTQWSGADGGVPMAVAGRLLKELTVMK